MKPIDLLFTNLAEMIRDALVSSSTDSIKALEEISDLVEAGWGTTPDVKDDPIWKVARTAMENHPLWKGNASVIERLVSNIYLEIGGYHSEPDVYGLPMDPEEQEDYECQNTKPIGSDCSFCEDNEETTRRDEKNGLYPDKSNDCN